MPFLALFLGIAAIVAAIWFSYVLKKKRREGFALMATQLGLQYFAVDPFGTLGEPFALFEKGDGRGVENVLAGPWQQVDVRCFDYWYYEESTDSNGHRTKTYYRFDCVIAPVEAACSRLVIEHENLGTRLANALTLNFIRALVDGGFADLHHPEYWDIQFVRDPEKAEAYRRIVAECEVE